MVGVAAGKIVGITGGDKGIAGETHLFENAARVVSAGNRC
jgi:hypothetical protein